MNSASNCAKPNSPDSFWNWRNIVWGFILFLILVLIILFSGGYHADFIYVDF